MSVGPRERLVDAVGSHFGGSESFEHSLRVARMAEEMAVVYGSDTDAAWLGGLLHDWARDLPSNELLASARRAGLEVTPVDEAVPYLLHAPVGAGMVADQFDGVPESVLQAIASHTFGSTDMGECAKIVYVADMIEPARDFPGVEDLRSAVGALSLDDLFAAGYRRSVVHLVESGKLMHPETCRVWNTYVAGRELP
ncbi:MAG: bis(5'-nucleosyl)-tetraphosphatase (symmetrical) YqeK [Coriobacteriia bacterium]